MLQVEGMTITFQGEPLFSEAGFTLQTGEKCGLVGRNGSGKSTLFRLLMGQEIPDAGTITTKRDYRIGMLDQHIRFSQPTLLEEGALGLRPQDEGHLYKIEAILFGLGFKEEDLDRPPTSFSGGYQLRIHLAKVLVSEPDCLLLDEPTNYLDIVSIRWFTRFLKQWKGEVILISHDREFMDSVTTHTMGIHRKKLRKVTGGTIAFYEQIIQEEEIHEKTRLNLEKKRAHVQAFIDRFGAKATKAAQAQSRAKLIGRIPTLEKLMALENLSFQFKEIPFLGHKMADLNEIDFSYTDSPLIQNLSLSIERQERIAIIGKNGRGKSTILRLLAGELPPKNGHRKLAENTAIGYFGQTHIDRLSPQHTIEDEISSGNPKLNLTEVRALAGLMMFSGDKAEKPISVLSGGERSRVLLGKILATPCNLLLLDEPTHHLDMESIEALIDALEEFEGAVVLVTHSELILRRLPLDKVLVCHEGSQKLFLGTYDDFLEKGGWGDEKGELKKKDKLEIKKKASPAPRKNPQEIAKLEEKISELEVKQQRDMDTLQKASEEGHLQEIQTISQRMEERGHLIRDCYDRL